MKTYRVTLLAEIEVELLISATNEKDAIDQINDAVIDLEFTNNNKKIGEITPIGANVDLKYISEKTVYERG